jgi:hypothetical protein
LLDDPALRQELSEKSLQWATRYSWAETGARTAEVLRKTGQGRAP